SFAAPSARTTLRSKRRSSFGGASPAGSKSLTSAAIRTGRPSASNARMKSMPLSPATAARQVSGAVFPTGVIAPRPVTTTRRTGESLVALAGLRPLADDQVDLGAAREPLPRARARAEHTALLLLRGEAARDLADAAVGLPDRRPRISERLADHLRDDAVHARRRGGDRCKSRRRRARGAHRHR